MTGWRRTPVAVCADVEAPEELRVEKRLERQHAVVLTHVAEKDFTFSDTLTLSPGREGAAEILTSRAAGTVTEAKVVGSKLIFKGVFTASLLYRANDGKCAAFTGELPFSQVMEVDGAAEGTEAAVRLQVTGADVQIDGGDAEGRDIAVTLYLHAAALLRQERDISLLSDLYSTAYDLSYEASPLTLTGYSQSLTRRQTVREVLEIGVVADSILALSAVCGAVSVSREGGTAVCCGPGPPSGRCIWTRAARRWWRSGAWTPAASWSCRRTATLLPGPSARGDPGQPGGPGIEVRFPVEFQAEASAQVKKVCITAARVNTDAPKDLSGAPSLVLRCLGRQETAWDLAKRHNTTISAILSANQLESEGDIAAEALLLIPRKRA
jgi:hypothetical protein